ncbi:AMSH-like ubiquitin thioesterase 2 isoform X5 [Camellia sinensis]|uniref:AMSH-like ubiquitin thioesterase 2 isoform X5 n=1 Tax=Camellia sinensis TaxID=4442 RepID=UPI0010362DBF|nr:AMSH-like ubiquitin thioesterase 2 isoform X5 [Camellia sinensis]
MKESLQKSSIYILRKGVHTVTQSSPSPTISCIHSIPHVAEVSRITSADSAGSSSDGLAASKVLKDVHISAQLMEDFLALARDNTDKDLETCGVLGAFLCLALNEEEIFAIQNEQSLYPVGWIHMMVPEAVAIVMAPTDNSRAYGIFRLSDPSGMNILKECKETGYHPHREPSDGSPIYDHCSNVYVNPNLRFEICDLR